MLRCFWPANFAAFGWFGGKLFGVRPRSNQTFQAVEDWIEAELEIAQDVVMPSGHLPNGLAAFAKGMFVGRANLVGSSAGQTSVSI
ncbi:hypothetical protein EC9_31490 [Rosistilla ulvae]|uniref:Uncharacterized protein n=1 Tax=Rosistilla ulvae TaxID=1930277 RepID=A0A517M249_9BACT|nr:hypothetical protein EC9_31490 [Rosistilla ulvae]